MVDLSTPASANLSSATPSPSGAMAMAAGGMDMTSFSFTTDVTLFFAGWRTDSPAKYFGTLVFTFFLTLLTRFLGAWRSQLGYKWANQAAVARAEHLQQRRRSKRDKKRDYTRTTLHPNSPLSDDLKAEFEPFSPAIEASSAGSHMKADDELHASKEEQILASLGPRWTKFLGNRWRAGHPWKLSLDAPRALLEGLRALFGYLLMLAVMTFNAGFLIVIILGVITGELIFGRFVGGAVWDEGSCHE